MNPQLLISCGLILVNEPYGVCVMKVFLRTCFLSIFLLMTSNAFAEAQLQKTHLLVFSTFLLLSTATLAGCIRRTKIALIVLQTLLNKMRLLRGALSVRLFFTAGASENLYG